jgi:alkaline phosphatase D
MRIATLLVVLLLGIGTVHAQKPGNISARTTLDSRYAPFYHGVASGDPMPDRVILWTRVTTQTTGALQVNWAVATDTGMTNVVQSGTATTHDTLDHTLHVDVTGLNPGTWYYYRFEYQGRYSLTGRTYTAPSGAVDSLRFGVVSCSNYEDGYFNAYGALVRRNDLHAILHLGDYIYEGGGDADGDRDHDPDHEIVDLEDYRIRHSQHKLDADLRDLHQMYPFVVVWDDHESSNNSFKDGAEGHNSGDGNWDDRKFASIKAYKEWMPLRDPDPGNRERIWRTLHYGNLVDLIMLDTRLYGRDEQVTGGGIDDPQRSLLGAEQLGWLSNQLETSTAQWKVIGQQVMVAPLEAPFIGPLNTDQWDGYRAERNRLYDSILTKAIQNVVFLTGDIHCAWANDLPTALYNSATGAGSVGVEYVCTSITSGNAGFPVPVSIISSVNEHIKHVNLEDHGYLILDLNQQRSQGDFWNITNITNPNQYAENWEQSWLCEDTTQHLQVAAGPATPSSTVSALPPPMYPPNVAIAVDDPTTTDGLVALLGGYPNPFQSEFMLKYYLHTNAKVTIRLVDVQGRVIEEQNPGKQGQGLHIVEFNQPTLAKGIYLAEMEVNGRTVTQRMIKQ